MPERTRRRLFHTCVPWVWALRTVTPSNRSAANEGGVRVASPQTCSSRNRRPPARLWPPAQAVQKSLGEEQLPGAAVTHDHAPGGLRATERRSPAVLGTRGLTPRCWLGRPAPEALRPGPPCLSQLPGVPGSPRLGAASLWPLPLSSGAFSSACLRGLHLPLSPPVRAPAIGLRARPESPR